MAETTPSRGRRPATTRGAIESAALELFSRQGFGPTTVDDVAAAAGIGRRTFFRYFSSKNDVVWGDFRGHLDRMRADLGRVGPAVPLGRALIDSIVAFNTYPDEELAGHRRRMNLILTVPELQAHSTLQYAAWRRVVADFVAQRSGGDPLGLYAQVVSRTALGAAVAAYDHWLREESRDLVEVLTEALEAWAGGLPLSI